MEDEVTPTPPTPKAKNRAKDHDPHLAHLVRAEIGRATGHRYADLELACGKMSRTALADLRRLITNLKSARDAEKRKRRQGRFW
jgi:hypothetical protein